MIPLMYLSSDDNLSSGTGINPPGNVPTTCVSNCNTPLPVIKDSLGNPVNIGDFWTEQGGYYSGLFTLTGKEVYALIISPKAVGHIYNKNHATVDDFTTILILPHLVSKVDGKKNTEDAINYIITTNRQALYPLWVEIIAKRNQIVGGFNDWYLPSAEETLLMLKYFHPDGGFCSYACAGMDSYLGEHIYPCNYCTTSFFNDTKFNNFKTMGSESLKNDNTGINGHYLSTSSLSFNDSEPIYYVYKYAPGHEYYWSTNGYTLSYPVLLESRLVRRVLVS